VPVPPFAKEEQKNANKLLQKKPATSVTAKTETQKKEKTVIFK
jgi:hypothetical protein